LAEADDGGIALFVQPAPAHDKFIAEITDMGHRSAEAGETQPQENKKDRGGAHGLAAAITLWARRYISTLRMANRAAVKTRIQRLSIVRLP